MGPAAAVAVAVQSVARDRTTDPEALKRSVSWFHSAFAFGFGYRICFSGIASSRPTVRSSAGGRFATLALQRFGAQPALEAKRPMRRAVQRTERPPLPGRLGLRIGA